MAGERERALDAGCNDFETKPVDLPKLLAKIAALLGG
jgi:CheY-like chemotaxis protein